MTVFNVAFRLRDSFNRETSRRYQTENIAGADIGVEFLQAWNSAQLLSADLEALSGAEVLWVTVGVKTTVADGPTANSNIDAGATLVCELDDGQKGILRVPAPEYGVVNPDGTIDITSATVTDFVDNFNAGDFTISDGQKVTALLSGKLDK